MVVMESSVFRTEVSRFFLVFSALPRLKVAADRLCLLVEFCHFDGCGLILLFEDVGAQWFALEI